jgi:alkylresorcinol/alkylpyrone synthase
MPKLTAVATAVPPYRVEQATAREFAGKMFGRNIPSIERLLPIFDHTGINSRYFSTPSEWFGEPHSTEEVNRLYIETATCLGAQACRDVLAKCELGPGDIDYILFVSTTGLATPSIDARLINVMQMRPDVRRTPIWGLGCAGGAAGLAHAYHHALGHPDHRVLLVAVELCGLTFIHDDHSVSNLVAVALFADGAAAALVCGDAVEADGLEMLATQSTFYPDSLQVMGWNVGSRGLQVVFDKRIPDIVHANAAAELEAFLDSHGILPDQVKQYLYHPGGTKVVNAYEQAYHVSEGTFGLSRQVLGDYGNMSSVTVLFVIDRYLEMNGTEREGYGVISALGPGFCSESLLVKL